jgi:hypothetical protein
MLHVVMAKELHRLEYVIKAGRSTMIGVLRRLASKIGTPTFGAEFFRPFISLQIFGGKGDLVGQLVPE